MILRYVKRQRIPLYIYIYIYSRPRVPFPRSRRDLGLELQGVQTKSQVSTPCYTAKQESVVDQEDNNSRKTPSSSHSDLEAPEEPKDASPVDPYKGLMTIKKEFTPDMAALGKEFDLEKNRVKREAYKANHTREQKQEVLAKWKEFMKETSSNHFHVSRWPQSALSFVYFCIVCNLPSLWYQSQVGRSVVSYCLYIFNQVGKFYRHSYQLFCALSLF